MKLPARRARPRAPEPDMTQTELERLLVHGLKVRLVTHECVTWDSPPTEAEQAFAQQLLERTVTHA